MALQASGTISLDDIHVEAGGSTTTEATINDSDIIGLISKTAGAAMSFSEWYGASAGFQATTSGVSVNSTQVYWTTRDVGLSWAGGGAAQTDKMIITKGYTNNTGSSVTSGATNSIKTFSNTSNPTNMIGGTTGRWEYPVAMGSKYVIFASGTQASPSSAHLNCMDVTNSTSVWKKKLNSPKNALTSTYLINGTQREPLLAIPDRRETKMPNMDDDEGCIFGYITSDRKGVVLKVKWSDGSLLWSFKTPILCQTTANAAFCQAPAIHPYNSTHVQVSTNAFLGTNANSIKVTNFLVNKSTGARSSFYSYTLNPNIGAGSYNKDVDAYAYALRNQDGAWAQWAYLPNSAKYLTGAFGACIRNSNGSIYQAFHTLDEGAMGCPFDPQFQITEEGRFVIKHTGYDNTQFGAANDRCFGVFTSGANPTWDFSKKLSYSVVKASHPYSEAWFGASGDGFLTVMTFMNGGPSGSTPQQSAIGMCHIDMSSAPTNGTYGGLTISSSSTQTLRAFTGNSGGSWLGSTGLTGSANNAIHGGTPASQSDDTSTFTATLSTTTGSNTVSGAIHSNGCSNFSGW
jgi:hypothetical protein